MRQKTVLSSSELPFKYVTVLFLGLGCAVFGRGMLTVILAEGEDWDTLLNKTFSQRQTLTADYKSRSLIPPSPPGFCL